MKEEKLRFFGGLSQNLRDPWIPGFILRSFQDPTEVAPASLSIWPYLGLSIITPATLSHLGAIVVPVGLGVGMSGIGFIVGPALLTLSCFCIIPAGLGVALGVAFVIIPATLGFLWVLVFIMFGRLLCGGLFLLQEVRGSGALRRVWKQEEV